MRSDNDPSARDALLRRVPFGRRGPPRRANHGDSFSSGGSSSQGLSMHEGHVGPGPAEVCGGETRSRVLEGKSAPVTIAGASFGSGSSSGSGSGAGSAGGGGGDNRSRTFRKGGISGAPKKAGDFTTAVGDGHPLEGNAGGGAASASRRTARRPPQFRKAANGSEWNNAAPGDYGGVAKPMKGGKSAATATAAAAAATTARKSGARELKLSSTRGLPPTKTDSSNSDSHWEVTVETSAEECLVCFEPFDDALNPPIRTKCLCGTTARLHLQVGACSLYFSLYFSLLLSLSLFLSLSLSISLICSYTLSLQCLESWRENNKASAGTAICPVCNTELRYRESL